MVYHVQLEHFHLRGKGSKFTIVYSNESLSLCIIEARRYMKKGIPPGHLDILWSKSETDPPVSIFGEEYNDQTDSWIKEGNNG